MLRLGLGLVLVLFSVLPGPARTWSLMFDRLHCRKPRPNLKLRESTVDRNIRHRDTTTGGSGVVVNGVRRMNEVNARRARLVPGWVTVFGWVYHLGM